jgi:hypothetical protein
MSCAVKQVNAYASLDMSVCNDDHEGVEAVRKTDEREPKPVLNFAETLCTANSEVVILCTQHWRA